MTIYLPKDIERSIEAAVQSGRFASVGDAIAEAWRLFDQPRPSSASPSGLGFIGALRDDAALLDQAVEHAMTVREERPWRLDAGE